jgi:hypothetical protein
MYPFSQKTLTALHEAGWTEDRQIDIEPFVQMLEKNGNVVYPVVADFLRKFGGLTISWPYPLPNIDQEISIYILAPYMPNLVHIVPQFALEGEEIVLGVKLCSIGCDNSNIELLMAESGKVYGSHGPIKFHLGNCGEELFETYANWHPIYNLLPTIDVD